MEIYNIYSGVNNIFNQLIKEDEICANDLLKMMEPFYTCELDYYDVQYDLNQIGGAAVAGEVLGGEVLGGEVLGGEVLGADGVARIAETVGGEKLVSGGTSGFIDKFKRKAMYMVGQGSPGSNSEKGGKKKSKWGKLRDMAGIDVDGEFEKPIKGEEKGSDAFSGPKKFLGNIAYISVILIFIGGMPILPWAIIIYYTYKKLKSGYQKLVLPI